MATSPLSSPSTTASHTTLQDRWSAAAAAVAPIAETPATTTTTTTTTTPVTTIPATTPTRQRKAHKLKARRMSPTMFRRDRPLPTSETDQFSVVSFNICACSFGQLAQFARLIFFLMYGCLGISS
eukprot:m.204234 g.204234  ORF g.204234 m.204234 type:complete len:125 (+) comp53862_c0_seq6:2390-2764(+)